MMSTDGKTGLLTCEKMSIPTCMMSFFQLEQHVQSKTTRQRSLLVLNQFINGSVISKHPLTVAATHIVATNQLDEVCCWFLTWLTAVDPRCLLSILVSCESFYGMAVLFRASK